MEKQGATTQELVLLVKPDGTVVKERGALSGKATNPSVQVLFEDNKNNEWNQTEWIKTHYSIYKKLSSEQSQYCRALYGWC